MEPIVAQKIAAKQKSQPLYDQGTEAPLSLETDLGHSAGLPLFLQRSPLQVSEPSDSSEQEADRTADLVMNHQPAGGCQRAISIQRQISQPSSGMIVSSDIVPTGGQPLPILAQEHFSSAFGHDFQNVRVHTDEQASARAHSVQARAFTAGQDIVFGRGEYNLSSACGQHLLAHELAHVVQQSGQVQRQIQRQTADERISSHTSWGNLNEEALGQELARLLPSGADEVESVLNTLSSSDRDDVAEAIVNTLSDDTLRTCSDGLLQRLRSELIGRFFSYTTDGENQAVARLDAAIRSNTVTQPIVTQAPAGAIALERFIGLIEQEEAKLPSEEQTNTRLMITRFRKLFYGTPGWDQYLIPNAASVSPLYRVEQVERPGTRRTVEMPWLPNLISYVDKSSRLPDAPENLQEPGRIQEVCLPDGTFVDLGHVFAGLDALNFPSMVDGPLTVNISRNVDAVTWVGDLGSVLAEAVLKATESECYVTSSEYQAIINEYASPQDMLGNIDAYVISDAFDISSTHGLKVSEILRQFYLGDASRRAHRYSRFAELVGLGTYSSGQFSNEAAWIDSYVDDVNDAAALYLGAQTEGRIPLVGTLLQRGPAAVGLAMNQGAEDLLIYFVQSLKLLVQKE